jgi:hypothetical protein
MIQLRFAQLEFTPDGAVTHFPDGTSWGAHPHDVPHYHALAHRLGYDGDILAYSREHELAHHVLSEGFGSHSLVLWALAHGETVSSCFAAAEEALAMALQRFVRANKRPFIDGADWDFLKARFLQLLENGHAEEDRGCPQAAGELEIPQFDDRSVCHSQICGEASGRNRARAGG